MSGRNGERKPPRPRIEMLSTGASEAETATIVAALEQFIADTAPPAGAAPEPSRWQRAALEEGVAARQLGGRGWGPVPLPMPDRSTSVARRPRSG